MIEGNNNIMLDLETLSTSSNSVIASIGAVRFGPTEIGDSIDITVNLQSCIDFGMVVDGDTLLWWLQQSEDARRKLNRPSIPISAALAMLAEWVGRDAIVWGNGSDFDNAVISSAYRTCGLRMPWRYTNNRCYRTVKNLFPNIELERTGTHHDAVDDATYQAKHLLMCLQLIE